ncbi:MAG: hypothetical protein WC942_05290 [Clostridia bacterium]|jgi:deoxycytidylate deaminase
MNAKIQSKIVEISKALVSIPHGKNKHFSFIVKRNNILSIGWNDYTKTHPMAKENGCLFGSIHSELSAVVRFSGKISDLQKCTLINTRVNTHHKFGMSKPCHSCQQLIMRIGFKEVWYTDWNGIFRKMV